MSQEAWNQRMTEAESVGTFIKFTGAGAAPVVKNFGRGVATTRTGVGIVNLVWDEFPGVYMGIAGYNYEATTASAVKGYTLVPGDYVVATRTLTINITNAADTLADLAAAQRLSLVVLFKRTGTGV